MSDFVYYNIYFSRCDTNCVCNPQMQELWRNYVEDAYNCCSPNFWRVYRTVRTESARCQQDVLTVVHKLQNQPTQWPQSYRTLRARVRRAAGDFWQYVTEKYTVDISQFDLPGQTSVEFSFIDPIFVWLQCCNAMHGASVPMHWDPHTLRHPVTHEELFGAGIQYGQLIRQATSTIPVEGKVALMSVSWDGGNTGYGSRSAVPICIQVMNVNSASADSIGLVGYLPHVEVSDSYKESNALKLAKRHVQQVVTNMLHLLTYNVVIIHICCIHQKCVGYVLRAIERNAKYGVRCKIGHDTFRLYPRLGALALDTPERVKYFGLRSNRACGICRLRHGRSATRYARCILHTLIYVDKYNIYVVVTP